MNTGIREVLLGSGSRVDAYGSYLHSGLRLLSLVEDNRLVNLYIRLLSFTLTSTTNSAEFLQRYDGALV